MGLGAPCDQTFMRGGAETQTDSSGDAQLTEQQLVHTCVEVLAGHVCDKLPLHPPMHMNALESSADPQQPHMNAMTMLDCGGFGFRSLGLGLGLVLEAAVDGVQELQPNITLDLKPCRSGGAGGQ